MSLLIELNTKKIVPSKITQKIKIGALKYGFPSYLDLWDKSNEKTTRYHFTCFFFGHNVEVGYRNISEEYMFKVEGDTFTIACKDLHKQIKPYRN